MTEIQIEQMIVLRRQEQLPLAEIGKRFGITGERVRQILNANSVNTRRIPREKPVREPSPRRTYDWDEIVLLHTEKELSSYDIGALFEANPTYIRQVLAKMDVLRPQSQAAALKRQQREEKELSVA